MGFRTGAYCTVWSVEAGQGNFTKVRVSTSRKNKNTGEYEQDFSGFCTFVGHAHAKAAKLKERDRIKLGDVDVTSSYNKEKAKEYINYVVFEYETLENAQSSGQAAQAGASSGENPTDGDAGDNCPF